MKEFLRFSELENKVLFSRIGPKNYVLPMLALHFSDRLRPERFIIYDEIREKAVIYTPNTGWYILSGEEGKRLEKLSEKSDRKEYETLWKIFFDSVAIKERENYNVSKNKNNKQQNCTKEKEEMIIDALKHFKMI